MAISIILAHPKPGSLNHAIAQTAAAALTQAGHQVNLHDLHAEGFDPLLPAAELPKGPPADPVIARHCQEIAAAEGIIIVHPNWWAMPPAILKGWLDRVLRMDVAYKFGTNDKGEGVVLGLLKAQAAIVFNTSNTPRDVELAVYGDPLENLWKTCICGFCGIRAFRRKQYGPVVLSTLPQRQAWLADVRDTVLSLFSKK